MSDDEKQKGESMFHGRYRRLLRRLVEQCEKQGRHDDAENCRRVLADDDMMAEFRDVSTAAYATSQGIEVFVAGEQSRPFLDFLRHLIDNEVFRKFGEWLLDHADEILKIIVTIIGM